MLNQLSQCRVFLIIIFCFGLSGLTAQNSFVNKAKKAKKLYDYGKEIAGLIEEFNSTREYCLSQGYSESHCDEAALLCTTFEQKLQVWH